MTVDHAIVSHNLSMTPPPRTTHVQTVSSIKGLEQPLLGSPSGAPGPRLNVADARSKRFSVTPPGARPAATKPVQSVEPNHFVLKARPTPQNGCTIPGGVVADIKPTTLTPQNGYTIQGGVVAAIKPTTLKFGEPTDVTLKDATPASGDATTVMDSARTKGMLVFSVLVCLVLLLLSGAWALLSPSATVSNITAQNNHDLVTTRNPPAMPTHTEDATNKLRGHSLPSGSQQPPKQPKLVNPAGTATGVDTGAAASAAKASAAVLQKWQNSGKAKVCTTDVLRCDGGGCDQRGCVEPTCDGGSCKQVDAFKPACDGGHCDQSGATMPSCSGKDC